jgi:hypothetical protein
MTIFTKKTKTKIINWPTLTCLDPMTWEDGMNFYVVPCKINFISNHTRDWWWGCLRNKQLVLLRKWITLVANPPPTPTRPFPSVPTQITRYSPLKPHMADPCQKCSGISSYGVYLKRLEKKKAVKNKHCLELNDQIICISTPHRPPPTHKCRNRFVINWWKIFAQK